ncbi:MAG: DUF1501 domain-containing protein [Planctomycetes bacterium]|nr:DUF1501 domain-containing protein [Planctomycetota bacterium]
MRHYPCKLTRRHFLAQSSLGIGGLALTWLLNEDKLLGAPERPELEQRRFDLTPKPPHFAPRARAMISMFMQGGPSHLDLFDPKPGMARYDGQPFPGTIQYDNAAEASARVLHSPWRFRKCGQAGIELSELLPALGEVADEICLIRSMKTGVNNHGQSINALNTGRILAGRPVLGSWITYGLGSESRNLPAYVVLTDPISTPVLGVDNWSNGYLPSLFQGTVVRAQEPRILNLDPPSAMRGQPQERYLDFLDRLNREHAQQRPGELDLEARISTYELAARMQTAAREALDISSETPATRRLYGIDDPASAEFGTRCLIARRLIERGVRFVQICTRNQFWDHHGNIRTLLPNSCRYVDRGSAALVRDLKCRGLLDSTVVHWGGEMGRLPVVQNERNVGRDHNTHGFSMWLAGGGFKPGMTHGNTDDFGHHAVENIVNHYDYQATLLHLFGLDHRRLTYQRNGQQLTLTDNQSARVVEDILRDGVAAS